MLTITYHLLSMVLPKTFSYGSILQVLMASQLSNYLNLYQRIVQGNHREAKCSLMFELVCYDAMG